MEKMEKLIAALRAWIVAEVEFRALEKRHTGKTHMRYELACDALREAFTGHADLIEAAGALGVDLRYLTDPAHNAQTRQARSDRAFAKAAARATATESPPELPTAEMLVHDTRLPTVRPRAVPGKLLNRGFFG